jgi:hypothetical protein
VKVKIIRALLVSLLQCDGVPMPETALFTAAQILCRPAQPTDGDIKTVMLDLQAQGFIAGVTDELTLEATWTLTDKGTHKARQLR